MANFSHFNLRRYPGKARAFAGDTRGNFGVMTGLLLVPLFGFSALAIDHWAVTSAKSEIENAADAAALSAINRAAAVLRATGDKTSAKMEGKEAGKNQFEGNVGKIPNTTARGPAVTVEIIGLEVKSKVDWTGVVKTTFGSLFNWGQQNLSGTSASSLTMPAYVQIHVMVDNSGSMGIGATPEAQDALFALNKCAIACHLNGTDKYTNARKAGIKTRIDIVRDVLVKVGKKTNASITIPNQIKIGVYTFSNDFIPLVKVTDPESTNMTMFEKKMEEKLGLTDVGGGTDFHGAFRNLATMLPKSGDGATESKPLVYVMFMTDGIEHTQQNKGAGWWGVDTDALKNGTPILVSPAPPVDKLSATYNYQGATRSDSGWIQPLDEELCKPVKGLGQLSTLEIEYIIPKSQYWDHGGSPDIRFGWVKDKILVKEGAYSLSHNRFRKCASTPQDAYSAKTDKDIEAAISAMFEKVIPKLPRLLK